MVSAVNYSIVKQSKRDKFLSSYFCGQNWTLPDSLIYSITMNPTIPKVYQKLIKSCKYFYIKNPIIVLENLYFQTSGEFSAYEYGKTMNLTNFSSKFWVTEKIQASTGTDNSLSMLVPKLYSNNIKALKLCVQIISLQDFLFLSSNLEEIVLRNVYIESKNSKNVTFEEVMKLLPKIKEIEFGNNCLPQTITKNTVKQLLKLPQFLSIDNFRLFEISEMFEIETFFTYIKKNYHTKFNLRFSNLISEDYKKRVEAIIDEIISAETHDYNIPYILPFSGLDREKCEKFRSLYYKTKEC